MAACSVFETFSDTNLLISSWVSRIPAYNKTKANTVNRDFVFYAVAGCSCNSRNDGFIFF